MGTMIDHTEDDFPGELDARLEADTRLLLHVVLATGALLLGLLGWVATL